ncbi:MAG: hypothetical protein AAF989_05490 [Planctomycetota bacterium]
MLSFRSFKAKHPSSITKVPAAPYCEKTITFNDLIRQTGNRGLAEVEATLVQAPAAEATVVLRGRVSSYYLKQLAQETIRPMAIGMEIRNELQVC